MVCTANLCSADISPRSYTHIQWNLRHIICQASTAYAMAICFITLLTLTPRLHPGYDKAIGFVLFGDELLSLRVIRANTKVSLTGKYAINDKQRGGGPCLTVAAMMMTPGPSLSASSPWRPSAYDFSGGNSMTPTKIHPGVT